MVWYSYKFGTKNIVQNRLHNLLKQYGGVDEYIQLNTEMQNQQQLKNFDLSEYRYVLKHIHITEME